MRKSAWSEGSRKTIPSAPTPVPRAQIDWTTGGLASAPAGSARASTMTKSFPDPLILKNSRPSMRPPRSDLAGHGPPPEPPHHPDRLSDDALRHLGLPLGPVHEHDRDLDEPEPLLPGTKAHLDLKSIPVRPDCAQVDRLQYPPAKALEAARRIIQLVAGDDLCVDVRKEAEQQSRHRPVDHGDPVVPVPRPQHEVGMLDCRQELRKVRGIVREVRVHLEDVGIVALESPRESCEVRRPQAQLRSPVKHVQPWFADRDAVRDV